MGKINNENKNKNNGELYLPDILQHKPPSFFSLSIRRFCGKRGKMEAKKGESEFQSRTLS